MIPGSGARINAFANLLQRCDRKDARVSGMFLPSRLILKIIIDHIEECSRQGIVTGEEHPDLARCAITYSDR